MTLVRAGWATLGADALSLRALAREIGVSAAASYRHFPDKRALLVAVAQEGHDLLREALEAAAAAHSGDAIEAFRAQGVAFVTFAQAHPAHFRVMNRRDILAADGGALHTAFEADSPLMTGLRSVEGALGIPPEALNEAALAGFATLYGLARMAVDGHLMKLGVEEGELAAVATALTGVLERGWRGGSN